MARHRILIPTFASSILAGAVKTDGVIGNTMVSKTIIQGSNPCLSVSVIFLYNRAYRALIYFIPCHGVRIHGNYMLNNFILLKEGIRKCQKLI